MPNNIAMNVANQDQHSVGNKTQNPGTYYLHARPEVLDLVPLTARKLLDVGCGAGGLSANLKARQTVEVHGVELVEKAADHARKYIDQVWNSTIEEALPNLPDKYYDCIVIADVLEHLLDPWTVLAELKNKLAEGGKLVASIPNIQNWGVLSELIQGKWDYRSEGILDRTHLRFFTRKSVEELFWNAGFRIAALTTTSRGPALTGALMDSFACAGLSAKSLEQDSQAFQFLVVAEVPNLAVMPKVTIVVLNWNGKDDTLECLASLNQLDYPNYEVVVVDNGSTDDSVEAISKQYPDVTLLQTRANLGYAGGNNVGIRWAMEHGADFVLILNNDTIIDPNLLSALVEAARIVPEAGIYGSKIYFYDRPEILWFAGGRWLTDAVRLEHVGYGQKDGPEFVDYRECDYVTGCALFARAEVFRKIGLLDESFFLTYEETDWCYRARDKGYRCLVVPQAKLWHKVSSSFGGSTSPLVTYFMTRNKLLWAKKYCSQTEWREITRETSQLARHILFPRFAIATGDQFIVKRIVWSLHSWWKIIRKNLAQPSNMAILYGLRDYYFRRLGDCPAVVRRLAKVK